MAIIPFPARTDVSEEAQARVLRPIVEEMRRQHPEAHAAALAALFLDREDPTGEVPQGIRDAAAVAFEGIAIELGAEPVRDQAARARCEAEVEKVLDEQYPGWRQEDDLPLFELVCRAIDEAVDEEIEIDADLIADRAFAASGSAAAYDRACCWQLARDELMRRFEPWNLPGG
jgi:hypothetical protein